MEMVGPGGGGVCRSIWTGSNAGRILMEWQCICAQETHCWVYNYFKWPIIISLIENKSNLWPEKKSGNQTRNANNNDIF